MSWTVLLTAPQREFKVRDELTLTGTSAYVPVEFRLGKGKPAGILKRPVLPGYVFADVADWGQLRTIDGLRSRPIILINGQPVSVSPAELQAVMDLARPVANIVRPGTRLQPKDRVAIKRGAMATVEGLITRILADGRAVAVVHMLGKAHEIIVTDDMVVA